MHVPNCRINCTCQARCPVWGTRLALLFHAGGLQCGSAAVLFGLLALGAVISSLINTSLDVGNARAVQLLAGLELVAFAVGLIFAGYFAHCLAS